MPAIVTIEWQRILLRPRDIADIGRCRVRRRLACYLTACEHIVSHILLVRHYLGLKVLFPVYGHRYLSVATLASGQSYRQLHGLRLGDGLSREKLPHVSVIAV